MKSINQPLARHIIERNINLHIFHMRERILMKARDEGNNVNTLEQDLGTNCY